MAALEAAFATRRGAASSVELPRLQQRAIRIDFSNVDFDGELDATHFVFAAATDFSNATFFGDARFDHTTFSSVAQFERATFFRSATFYRATFSGVAWFKNATFSGEATFNTVTFSGDAEFNSATFSDIATFNSATFSRTTGFDSAIFSDITGFTSATFRRQASFVNATVKGTTSFAAATFETKPPRFFGASLHQGTVWRGMTWPTAPRDKRVAGHFVDAYACLKLEMDRLKKHEDELDFFVLEMRARQVMYGPWRGLPILLYGYLCDYGRSYVRPIYYLLGTILAGYVLFWIRIELYWNLDPLHKRLAALGLSIANTFGILGLRKDFVGPETIHNLPAYLVAVGGLQTVLGAIFLFLLGLALRNRFRMK